MKSSFFIVVVMLCMVLSSCEKQVLSLTAQVDVEVNVTDAPFFYNGTCLFHGFHAQFVDGFVKYKVNPNGPDSIFVQQEACMQYGMDSVYRNATGMLVTLGGSAIVPYQLAPFSGEYRFTDTCGVYAMKFSFDDGYKLEYMLVIE